MFERYTEKARRVIFFARYEASQFGAPAIEPEHLLLGLMREDKTLTGRFFPRAQITIESIRREIESRTDERARVAFKPTASFKIQRPSGWRVNCSIRGSCWLTNKYS